MESDLKNGLLVPLFEHRLRCNFSYYFVCPEEVVGNPGIDLFRKWTLEQMGSLRQVCEELL